MRRLRLGALIAVMVFLLASGTASASVIGLTNSFVDKAELELLFDFGVDVGGSMNKPFDFEPFAATEDGTVWSAWHPGLTGTAAENRYMYEYKITVNSGSSDDVSAITVRFPGLIQDLDINGSGVDTSFMYGETGKAPFEFAGYFPNYDGDEEVIEWLFMPKIDKGEFSVYFGAVSSLGPGEVAANLADTDSEESPNVFAPVASVPVPEPSTLMLLGSGLVGLGLYRWRRTKI